MQPHLIIPRALSDRPASPPIRSQLARPAPGGPIGQTTNIIAPPQWPFKLVSLSSEPKAPTAPAFSRGAVEFRQGRLSRPPVNAASGAIPSAWPAVLASRHTPRVDREAAPSRLIARPMAHPQPAITTPQPFIPGLPSGPGLPLLALFERNRPAHTRDFQVASEQGVPARQPASSPALQTPAAPILRRNVLTGRAPDHRAGSTPRPTPPNPSGSAQPVPAEPVQSGLPPSLQPTSQVRPPQAMLTLLPARQPETGSTGERAESPSFQGMLEQEWPLLSVLHRLETRPAEPTEFGRRAGTAPHVARAGRPRPPDPAFAGSRGSRRTVALRSHADHASPPGA